MKKLNRKGFTLVELLAVIIILAIVVGVTIPAVLGTIASSRKKSGENAAQIVANWIDEQYVLGSVDASGVNADFAALCGANGSGCKNLTEQTVLTEMPADGNSQNAKIMKFVIAAGLKVADVEKIAVTINDNGKSCVVLTPRSTGSYYITADSNKTQTYTAGTSCPSLGYKAA